MNQMKILFFGDVVGAIGRKAVAEALPKLRAQYAPDLVVANVENLAHGRGITAKTLLEMDATGIDAYTSGNHVWQNESGLSCFSDERWKHRLIRPANVIGRPGVGMMKRGRVVFLNLLGRVLMKDEVQDPFAKVTELLTQTSPQDIIIVDFHAEATSEKEAFGHFLDGKVTAIFGTHTHVPTADHKILPGGTAYVTDVGRNGASDSVVGFEKEDAVRAFTLGQLGNAIPEHGVAEINAMLLTVDLDTSKAATLDRIRIFVDV